MEAVPFQFIFSGLNRDNGLAESIQNDRFECNASSPKRVTISSVAFNDTLLTMFVTTMQRVSWMHRYAFGLNFPHVDVVWFAKISTG